MELKLMQAPYAEFDGEDHWYQAYAIDSEDNDYMIKWDIKCMDCEDETDACDWEKYRVERI